MNKQDEIKFSKFKKAVFEYDSININELYILINRITCFDRKRYFGYNPNQKFNARLKYHKYWIKLLEGQGFINLISETSQIWKVNNDKNKKMS